jgi:hypothetical protein
MKPLSIIYWTRVLWGIIAASISAWLSGFTIEFNILNGVSIALLLYIITYYVYKPLFHSRVEKTTKIFTTGVGAYFLTWLVMFGLLFTLISPALVVTSPAPGAVFVQGDMIDITTRISNQLGVYYSGANVTANSPSNHLIQLNETSPGIYEAKYNTSSDQPGAWKLTVRASIDGRYQEAFTLSVHIQTKS